VSTNRLESFSDGVLAVAITLLVLDITVPDTRHLAHALLHEWSHYAAYVTSFLTIGIIWVNHHAMLSRLRETDHTILMLNLVLLMTIGLIPFATALFAAYLNRGTGEHLAAGVYAGVLLAMALAFAALNWNILFRRTDLMNVELSHESRRRILSWNVIGLLPYVLATALAVVSAYLTLGITATVAVYYALPLAGGFGVKE
jgi:TMEM175 potassium channel family protein